MEAFCLYIRVSGYALEYFGYATMLESNDFIKVDTVNVVSLKWNPQLSDSIISLREVEMKKWLDTKLNDKRILILRE